MRAIIKLMSNDYATKDDVKEIVGKAVEDLSNIIADLAQSMHEEIVELKKDNQEIKQTLNKLLSTMDSYYAQAEEARLDLAASDSRFEKLLAWARDVSEKTGIQIRDL